MTPEERLADVVCRQVFNAELHAAINGHHLDRDCQGVGPGEHVPAIRTAGVWAVVAGALRECGVPFPEEYRALLDG